VLCAEHLSQERCWIFLERLIGMGTTPTEHAAALGLAADTLAELERFKGQGPLNARIAADALAILAAPPQAVPAAARVICGRALARVGDPRPGVCTLPPQMVPIAGGSFVIGSTREEADQAGQAYEAYWLGHGDKETAKRARKWPEDEINTQPITIAPFEIARYPVTNAQFKLFMDDDGYTPEGLWWNDAGRAWLARDDAATAGLESRQRREFKERPEFWDDERYGVARPNHPVVGITWYEASAFCCWLTQHPVYNPEGYTYKLPSEAEWEYAARGTAQRLYPWGPEEPDGERANFNRLYDGTTAVGCFPLGATPERVLDMAGNVGDWTRSVYAECPYDPADGREALDDAVENRFAVRGGGWDNPAFILRVSDRGNVPPDGHHDYFIGFRLARHFPM
jgi:formylglycine-generating enzyme required for sulfatase activity